jgi:transcriptional regulator with XRE-family HTH domain
LLSISKHKDKSFFSTLQIQKHGFMKSDIDLFVINRIREKRKELKVSQRGMAEILGCSAGFIGQVESENSDTKYSVHQLYLIAKDFDCSPADFFPSLDSDF